jgi:DnaJ-class molecular chaperone
MWTWIPFFAVLALGGGGGSFSFRSGGTRGRTHKVRLLAAHILPVETIFFGFGGAQPGFGGVQQTPKGQDLLYEMSVTPQEIYNGNRKRNYLAGGKRCSAD